MSRRTPALAEDPKIRVLILAAGIVLAFSVAPARAQEGDDAEPGTEAVDDAGTVEDTGPGDETPAEEPGADPRAEARRKAEEAAAEKLKAKEEARQKAIEEREAARKAKEAAKQKVVDERDAKRKAAVMEKKRREEEARKQKGVKEREDVVLDEETLANMRKPEEQLRREAAIAAAQVSLPSDLRLTYLWSLPLQSAVSQGDIWVHRDVILLLADGKDLYCIRKRDGVPMWAIELGRAPLYPPAVSERMVYVIIDNSFTGIDRARGEVLWRINPGFAPSGSPCVSEPNLYVPAWDKRIYAVEVASSRRVFYGGRAEDALKTTDYRFRELWHKTTGGYILGTPVLLDGFLYFGSEDGYLYAVSQDGEDRYNAQTQGPIRTPVTSRGANVYVGSSDFSAYAFDRLTGTKQWVFPTGSHVQSAIYPDVPAGVALVPSSKNGIFGISDRATAERGTPAWHIADAVSIAGVSKDYAYLNLNDRRLAAVEKKAGTVQWVSLLEGIREVVPTMNDWTRSDEQFRLICLTDSGHLACLREPKEAVRRALEKRE